MVVDLLVLVFQPRLDKLIEVRVPVLVRLKLSSVHLFNHDEIRFLPAIKTQPGVINQVVKVSEAETKFRARHDYLVTMRIPFQKVSRWSETSVISIKPNPLQHTSQLYRQDNKHRTGKKPSRYKPRVP